MSDPSAAQTRQRPERWRLHRSGFADVWVYGIEELDISGGRQILQGPNGSGKSRSLELQLPFCLDGDLKYLGTKGANTVSMRRLMLEEYSGGQVRIGYCWLELRRVRGGEEEFLTCGVGVKAVKTSNEIKGVWRFITPRRVGHDFALVSADRVAVDMAELQDLLGQDVVFENYEDFRARVGSTVYGIADQRRYQDLLHLQRTLRNPDVGLKAATGELEAYLSLALPPLNPDLIARLAGQLQDLEAIGANIKRLRQAESALSVFMATYTVYTQAVLRQRGAELSSARTQLSAHLIAAEKRKDEVALLKQKVRNSKKELDELERQERDLANRIRDMEGSEQYRELSEIDRRRRNAEARGGTVHSYLESASRARTAEEHACQTVVREMAGAHAIAVSLGTVARDAAAKVGAIGLDPVIVPTPPSMADPTPRELVEPVLLSAEPGAGPQPLRRVLPPELDVDRLAESIGAALIQTGLAAEAVSHQRLRIGNLLTESRRLAELQTGQLARLRFAAEQAVEAETAAAEALGVAESALTVQLEAWAQAQAVWLNTAPASTVDLGRWPEPVRSIELSADPTTAVASARRQFRTWATPALDAAQNDLQRAKAHFGELSADRQRLLDERRALIEGAEIAPPERLARDERDGRAGAPFYQLVDFVPSLSDRERGGLEAALQNSGLLDAWVFPDGTLANPELADLVALAPDTSPPDPPRDGDMLSRILTSLAGNERSVPANVVHRLLSAVHLYDEQGGTDHNGLSVSTTGHWRAGILTGLASKPIAEYLGEAAREATRARRIAELDEALTIAATEIKQAQTVLRNRTEAQRTWHRHLEDIPEPDALLRAHTTAALAEAAHRTATDHTKQTSNAHKLAQDRWNAQHDVLIRQAGEANLPHKPSELEQRELAAAQAAEACRSLRERGNDLSAALGRLAPGMASFQSAKQDRVTAEGVAAAEHREYREELDAVAFLMDSLDLSAVEFEDQLTGLRDRLESARQNIPSLRRDKEAAAEQAAKREGVMENDASVEADRKKALEHAERAFVQAVMTPGFWMAATRGREISAPGDSSDEELLARVAEFPARPADNNALANEVGNLNKRLPNDLDAEFFSVGEGAFGVRVSGADGVRPVAAEARSVQEKLEMDQAQLDDRYRAIFEQYLLQDLSEHLRYQIDTASALCNSMNAILAAAETSQGIGVRLAWDPAPTIDDDTREALQLVRKSLAVRTPDEDDRLRRALQERIEAEQDRQHGLYAQALAEALDYRKWYTFTVKVQDKDSDGKDRLRTFKKLSSGETRFVAYIVLIAAAAAFYDALTEPGTDPLRVVLLDEAFERIDDPTITKLLELLAELDMDWIITWPGGSAFSPKIERMHVYDVLRRKNSRSIALMHTTWDGSTLRRQT